MFACVFISYFSSVYIVEIEAVRLAICNIYRYTHTLDMIGFSFCLLYYYVNLVLCVYQASTATEFSFEADDK